MFRKLLAPFLALALAGCAATTTTTPAASGDVGIFNAKYFPPTAAALMPACSVDTPTPADQNACMLYKLQVFNCQLNLNAVGGMVGGVVMLVPGYGPAITAGMAVAQPVIDMAQLTVCTANGFIVPAPSGTPPPAAVSVKVPVVAPAAVPTAPAAK